MTLKDVPDPLTIAGSFKAYNTIIGTRIADYRLVRYRADALNTYHLYLFIYLLLKILGKYETASCR